MKKLIPFILLVVLASSSLLLAQSNNRLKATNQVTGDRLPNQVAGCRLQVVGSNQGTDCRFQKVEEGVMNEDEYNVFDNQSSLLANNPAPISYLLSSIFYLGVTPKLMMDPLTVGKGTEALGKELGVVREQAASGKTVISTSEVASSTASFSSSFSEQAGRNSFAVDCSEAIAISARIADLSKLGAQAHAAGKKDEGNSWDTASKSSQTQLDYHTKAIEAREAGKEVLATGYEEAARISQRAAEKQEQSALAFAVGQEEEGHSWFWSGYSLQAKADYEAKACEAQEAGQLTLAEGYGNAAVLSGEAADQWELSTESKASGKISESNSWGRLGYSLQAKADYEAKACEAQKSRKVTLAEGYRNAAVLSGQAADQLKLSVDSKAAEEISECNSLGKYSVNPSVKCALANYESSSDSSCSTSSLFSSSISHLPSPTAVTASPTSHLPPPTSIRPVGRIVTSLVWLGDTLQSQADYEAQACEEQEAKKSFLADKYRNVIKILQSSVKYQRQAVSAFIMGQEEEGAGWLHIGKYLRSKVDDQVKNDQKIEKTQSVASKIKKDNKDTLIVGADEDSNSEPLTKKQRIIGTDTMKKMALSICCEKWLAETKSAKGEDKILSDYVVDVLKRGADHEVVKSFEEHCEHIAKARELGDYSLALAWIQVAEDIQQAMKDSIQKAQASKNKGWRVTEAWQFTVQAGQKLAKYREKYIQVAASLKNPEIIVGSKKIIEGLETIIIYYRKAAEAYSLGNEQEYDRFRKVAYITNKNIEQLEKIVNAFKKSIDTAAEREAKMSIFWRKIVEQREKLSEYYEQAISSKLSKKFTGSVCFNDPGILADQSDRQLNEASLALEKTTEAKKASQPEIADLCFKSGECYQKSAEYYYKAMVDVGENSGSLPYDNYYRNAGLLMENVADQLKKAVSARENAIQSMAVNQKQLAASWIKTATQYQESAEYFSKAVSAIDPDCVSEADNSAISREELLKLKMEIEAGNLSQYTLSQHILNEPSPISTEALWRAMAQEGIPQLHKTILEQVPYEISSTSIAVSSLKEASASLKKLTRAMEENEKKLATLWYKTVDLDRSHKDTGYIPEVLAERERIRNSVFWSKLTY